MPQDSDKAKPGQPLDGAPNGKGDAATLPLFYRRPEPLSLSAHGGKALRQPPDFRFAATAHAVHVVLDADVRRVLDAPTQQVGRGHRRSGVPEADLV